MRLCLNKIVRIWLSALILLAATAPVYAAAKPVRAVHFMMIELSMSDAKHLIDEASKAKFNTVILGLPWGNGLKLNSTPWVTLSKMSWSRDDLLSVSQYARQKGLEIVPQLTLLTHQELLLSAPFPELMFNTRTYDPDNAQIYAVVLPIVDEIIELLHPKAIHIGHDEVAGWNPRRNSLKRDENILPADLFAKDVNLLHEYLKKRKIETWIWGDMLVSPAEFPSMDKDGLHGIASGYGRELRHNIPKDIVICDWHYLSTEADFPTLAIFKSEGFRALGTTWRDNKTIDNFSQYAAQNGADGMIASTWFIPGAKGNRVVNNWTDMEALIHKSGETFIQHFPDKK